MGNSKKSNHRTKPKPKYKGPYQKNPNQEFEYKRKHMNAGSVGPTVDAFSQENSTLNYDIDQGETYPYQSGKRPSKRNLNLLTKENIILFVLGLIATGVGVIAYNHSNNLVAIEKDVEHLQDDTSDHEKQIKEVSDKTTALDKEFCLLKQRVEDKGKQQDAVMKPPKRSKK